MVVGLAAAALVMSGCGGDDARRWTIGDAQAALDSPDATVLVLGDSTGDSIPFPEWVTRWSAAAGLNVATWDPGSEAGYGPAVQPEQPVWVWNASMSGSRADYPLGHWDATWPAQTPDLILLSYGHNYTLDPENIEPHLDALRARLAAGAPDAPIVVILQQPQRGDANVAQRERVAAWATERGLPTIDIAAAFRHSGQPEEALLADDIHPSELGSQVWADAVRAALQ